MQIRHTLGARALKPQAAFALVARNKLLAVAKAVHRQAAVVGTAVTGGGTL